MKIGYARVSTTDQNLDLQIQALKQAGCEQIFQDQISGGRMDRPGLTDALSRLQQGSTLVVWKLDRLARSVKGLVDLVADLEAKDVQFRSLTDQIDTGTPAGRFFFHVMGALAQMEKELCRERTMAGLRASRLRGRIGGRKRKMTANKIDSALKLLKVGTPPKEVASSLGISVPTLYRWLPASSR